MLDNILYQAERFGRAFFESPNEYPPRSVILASFPKSGNSWFRFIVSNVNSIIDSGGKVNFHSINEFSPVIRGNRCLKDARLVDECPIFLKTHFPHTRFFNGIDTVVIVRNPFYVIPSYHNYLIEAREKSLSSDIEGFYFHWRYGLNAWARFMASWEKNATVIVRYEDLQANPAKMVHQIYQQLGYEIDTAVIDKAIRFSTRDGMKSALNTEGDPNNNNNFRFVKDLGENKGIEHLKKSILDNPRITNIFMEQARIYGYI